MSTSLNDLFKPLIHKRAGDLTTSVLAQACHLQARPALLPSRSCWIVATMATRLCV